MGLLERKFTEPLAWRMRPVDLSEIVGQEHLLGPGKPLRRAIENGYLFSMILWGPPGCGKSSLARVLADKFSARLVRLSAVSAGVPEIRKAVSEAEALLEAEGAPTILFIDEIHRFSKTQQDVLLPHVESGTVTLVGSTTENPRYSLVPALLSRCAVIEMHALEPSHITSLLERALADKDRGLGYIPVKLERGAIDAICKLSGGDARVALNLLELVTRSAPVGEDGLVKVTEQAVLDASTVIGGESVKDLDLHYDLVSAFIKSMRGSDPDAAVYWLARMILAGEDLEFICRRLVIAAAEDIGNADPTALMVATAAAEAARTVGFPEARIPLAQAAIYLACAPKSNSAYAAISKAMEEVKEKGPFPVPVHIRYAAEGYLYPHDYPGKWVDQSYLPAQVKPRFVHLSDQGYEVTMKNRLETHAKS